MSKRKPRKPRRPAPAPTEWKAEQWLIELWGVHQALRSMGFSAEDIFVGFGRVLNVDAGTDCVFVLLRTQGKEFTYTIGPLPGRTAEQVYAEWGHFVSVTMRGVSPTDMEAIYRNSEVGKNFPHLLGFVAALTKAGFHIPSLDEQISVEVAKILVPDPEPPKPVGEA